MAMHGETYATRCDVLPLSARNDRLTITTFYSEPWMEDAIGRISDVEEFVTTKWCAATALTDADVFVYGPRSFLR